MCVLGIGVDIAEVGRFERDAVPAGFFERVFTDAEIQYCRSHVRPQERFAARFAAKEATFKAVHGFVSGLTISQIEVFVDEESGAPSLRLVANRRGDAPPELPTVAALHLSLSHTKEYAVAFVIAQGVTDLMPGAG